MSIERIKNYILENAQKEAEQITMKARERFCAEVNKAQIFLEKQYKEMLQGEEIRLKEDTKRTLSTLKNDYKMKLLEIKNGVIDDVMSRAVHQIQSLTDKDYLSLMARWVANLPSHVEGQLLMNEKDLKKRTGDFVDDINKNRTARITLIRNAVDIKGGFVFKTSHYEIDYTLDTIIKNLRTTLITELITILPLQQATT